MNISDRKWLFIITLLIVLGVLFIIAAWMFSGRFIQESPVQNTPSPPFITVPLPTPSTQTNSSIETKIYRNTEFGFEFEYPGDFIIRENALGYSPFSKFDLAAAPVGKEYLIYRPDPPFLIDIVIPDFVERQFSDLDNVASEITIGGVRGNKYEYKEQASYITIILPLGRNRIILSTTKKYEDVFNQILTSFKFLK